MLLALIILFWINLLRMQLAISTSALLGVRPLNCAPRLNCEGELWGAICAWLVEVSIFVLYVRCNMAFAKYIYHSTIQYYLACLYCLDYTFGIYIHSRNYVWIYYIYSTWYILPYYNFMHGNNYDWFSYVRNIPKFRIEKEPLHASGCQC